MEKYLNLLNWVSLDLVQIVIVVDSLGITMLFVVFLSTMITDLHLMHF